MGTRLPRRALVVFGILWGLALASPAQAQICPGSQLLYIVRDSNGAPLDAAARSFTFHGNAETPWIAPRGEPWDNFPSIMPSELLRAVKGTITALHA